nr:class I tRNA ligase family protein [Catenulispora pinisilvae]
MRYPKASAGTGDEAVPASPRFPAIEERVLDYWAGDGTFRASVENRPAGDSGANEFVFYDGPPFANGLPHYGHLLTGYVKDLIPRYQTMRGKRVERRVVVQKAFAGSDQRFRGSVRLRVPITCPSSS